MKRANFLLSILFIMSNLFVFGQKRTDFNADKQVICPKPYTPTQTYKIGKRHSVYITMSDSVKIAVDYYLPKGLSPQEKVPTVFYMTRYWRGVDLTLPPVAISKIPATNNFEVLDFVKYGYAVVAMDVRGTGASQGSKCLSMPDTREIQDGKEVLDWVVEQKWSNGKVGVTGISYIGITAELMLLTKHPSIQAIAPLFSLYDAYDDMSNPNGIYYEQFLAHWFEFCKMMDNNALPGEKQNWIISTLAPVVSHKNLDKKEFKKAMAEHKNNAYRTDWGSSLSFLDQKYSNDGTIMARDFLSPHLYPEYYQNTPVYVMSGWKDAALVNGSVKQFLNWKHPGNKMLLGPWTHGGSINAHPYGRKHTDFSIFQEILKFFDFYIKGIPNGIDQEPKVHYYSFEHGKSETHHWYSSPSWPPANTTEIWSLQGNKLSAMPTSSLQEKTDTLLYKPIRYSKSTPYSRWNLTGHAPIDEEKSSSILKNGIVLYSNPFTEDRKITGHILLHGQWASTHVDPEIFYYLIEIPEKGEAKVISDGLFRLIHSTTLADKPLYTQVGPFYSYSRALAACLVPNQFYSTTVDFYPVSYQIQKKSKIALVVTTSDKSYFNVQNGSADIQLLSNFQLEIPFEK